MEINMKDNFREGKGIYYYNNGQKYEGNYKNDIPRRKRNNVLF